VELGFKREGLEGMPEWPLQVRECPLRRKGDGKWERRQSNRGDHSGGKPRGNKNVWDKKGKDKSRNGNEIVDGTVSEETVSKRKLDLCGRKEMSGKAIREKAIREIFGCRHH